MNVIVALLVGAVVGLLRAEPSPCTCHRPGLVVLDPFCAGHGS